MDKNKYRSIGSPVQENSFFKNDVPIIRDDASKLVCLAPKGDTEATGVSIALTELSKELKDKILSDDQLEYLKIFRRS